MNKTKTIALIAAVVAALGAGYWLGSQRSGQATIAVTPPPSASNPATKERKVLFYRNPMGLPDTSPDRKSVV